MIQGGRLGRLGPGQAGERAPAPELLSVAFNQDGSMFSAAMADGFRIYASDPPVQRAGHVFGRHGGIGMATMLGRSNLLALVGGGKAPQYPCNKVQLWDDTRGRIVAEAELRRDVKRVCISRERVLVALPNAVHVLNLQLQLQHEYETQDNPYGACAMCRVDSAWLLAMPGRLAGHVQLVTLPDDDATMAPTVNIVRAHDSGIACVALSADSRMLATASHKGTLIRVWDTHRSIQLAELRRGIDHARIDDIVFSPPLPALQGRQLLSVASDKMTIHLFDLQVESAESRNVRSRWQSLGPLLPSYFTSEWSSFQANLAPADKLGMVDASVKRLAWRNGSLLCVSTDGLWRKFVLPPMDGDRVESEQSRTCTLSQVVSFL